MAPTATVDAEKLYEKEIQRLQAELANIESETHKAQARKNQLIQDSNELAKEIEKQKKELENLHVRQKADDEVFKQSRANSVAAMEKREKEANERYDRCEKREADAHSLEMRALTARNSLVGLAGDIKATLAKFTKAVEGLNASILPELSSYEVLRSPDAEIPKLKK